IVSGECAVAPSTPNPPARLTAATTSRQWLKASSGNSIPRMSQIGDFMVGCSLWRPRASRSLLVLIGGVDPTLTHRGLESQACCENLILRRPHSDRLEGCRPPVASWARDGANAPPHHEE